MRFVFCLLAVAGCSSHLGVAVPASSPPPPAPRPEARASLHLSMSIQFYGVPLGGANDLVFVLDRSGSMSGDKMAHAKRELLRVIDQLPDGTRVGLVFFNSAVARWTRASVVGAQAAELAGGSGARRFVVGLGAATATRASGHDRELVALGPMYRRQAHRFVESIEAAGSTAAVPALQVAADIGARHIVFLSDGLANTGGDGGELMELAAECGRRGIRIDTIGLGADQDFEVLGEVAAATGGIAVVR